MRVEASSALVATMLRVTPTARMRWYSFDIRAARVNSHHGVSSQTSVRRSSQLVRKTSTRSTKYAVSCSGSRTMVCRMPERVRRTSSGVSAAGVWPGQGMGPRRSSRPPARANIISGGATRLSHTPFALPAKGMRRIVSGRLW